VEPYEAAPVKPSFPATKKTGSGLTNNPIQLYIMYIGIVGSARPIIHGPQTNISFGVTRPIEELR
jgi:hypothetical protein